MTKKVPSCEHKDREIHAKGLCRPCYFKKLMKENPDMHKKILEKKREDYRRIKKENPDYFNKKAREWQKKKKAKYPNWNAERQRKYRKEHPEQYAFLMAKYYCRKLKDSEHKKQLIKILEGESG